MSKKTVFVICDLVWFFFVQDIIFTRFGMCLIVRFILFFLILKVEAALRNKRLNIDFRSKRRLNEIV